MLKRTIWLPFFLAIVLLANFAFAQENSYIQINHDSPLQLTDGQSFEIVLMVTNPGEETLTGVQVICTLPDNGIVRFLEDRTLARNFNDFSITENLLQFPDGESDITLTPGQTDNLALGIVIEDPDGSGGELTLTCDFIAEGDVVDSTTITLLIPSTAEPDPTETPEPYVQVNSGVEMTFNEGQEQSVVIQYGNLSGGVLPGASLLCTFNSEDGTVSVLEDSVMLHVFESFTVAVDETVTTIAFPSEDSSLMIPAGQNYNASFMIRVDDLEESTDTTTVTIDCQIWSTPELTVEVTPEIELTPEFEITPEVTPESTEAP